MTVRDIAKEANVSIATVSRIINGDFSRVSAVTKDRVLDIVRRSNYVPKKNSVKNSLKRFILVVPSIDHMFFSVVAKEASGYALRNNLEMVLYSIDNSVDSRDDIIKRIACSDIDWILYMGISSGDQDSIISLLPPEKKIVFLDNILYKDGIPASVIADGEEAMFALTEYYIGKGHRSIAYITGTKDSRFNNERHKGYARALFNHNIIVNPELTRFGDFSFESGYECMDKLFSLGYGFSAVICENDMMALGAMKSIHEHGLSVPDDISISGFDDTYIADKLSPALTTIRQPLAEIIEKSFSLLSRMSSGEQISNYIIKLPCRIIERESVVDFVER